MREIRLIKQIHPVTATPWGLHVSEGDRFEMLPGEYVTEKDAQTARADTRLRKAAEQMSKNQTYGKFRDAYR